MNTFHIAAVKFLRDALHKFYKAAFYCESRCKMRFAKLGQAHDPIVFASLSWYILIEYAIIDSSYHFFDLYYINQISCKKISMYILNTCSCNISSFSLFLKKRFDSAQKIRWWEIHGFTFNFKTKSRRERKIAFWYLYFPRISRKK